MNFSSSVVVASTSKRQDSEPDTDSDFDNATRVDDSETERSVHDFDISDLSVGDYVIVQFAMKTQVVHYVGEVVGYSGEEFEVKFMRCNKKSSNKFLFPDDDDICDVPPKDIIKRLPKPALSGGTARARKMYVFPCDISMYNPK